MTEAPQHTGTTPAHAEQLLEMYRRMRRIRRFEERPSDLYKATEIPPAYMCCARSTTRWPCGRICWAPHGWWSSARVSSAPRSRPPHGRWAWTSPWRAPCRRCLALQVGPSSCVKKSSTTSVRTATMNVGPGWIPDSIDVDSNTIAGRRSGASRYSGRSCTWCGGPSTRSATEVVRRDLAPVGDRCHGRPVPGPVCRRLSTTSSPRSSDTVDGRWALRPSGPGRTPVTSRPQLRAATRAAALSEAFSPSMSLLQCHRVPGRDDPRGRRRAGEVPAPTARCGGGHLGAEVPVGSRLHGLDRAVVGGPRLLATGARPAARRNRGIWQVTPPSRPTTATTGSPTASPSTRRSAGPAGSTAPSEGSGPTWAAYIPKTASPRARSTPIRRPTGGRVSGCCVVSDASCRGGATGSGRGGGTSAVSSAFCAMAHRLERTAVAQYPTGVRFTPPGRLEPTRHVAGPSRRSTAPGFPRSTVTVKTIDIEDIDDIKDEAERA